LRYRYHEYVNEGKFAEIPGLFTADGELDFAHLGKANGHNEIARFFGALNQKPSAGEKDRPRITWVKQFIHNHTIELDGDRGRGFSYLEAKRFITVRPSWWRLATTTNTYVRTASGNSRR